MSKYQTPSPGQGDTGQAGMPQTLGMVTGDVEGS